MAKAVVTLKGGGTFIVSNRLCVIPRFTGGNGDTGLTYGWEVLDADKTQTKGGTTNLRRDSAGKVDVDNDTVPNGELCLDGKAAEVSSLIQTGTKYGGLILKNSELKPHESWTKDSQTVKYINFTFWDKTDETVQGEDSLWALVKLPCYINVVDDVAPNAYINPFYWTSWEDSSTYIDKETDLPDGHIDDLEEDLLAANKTLTNPKVSGTVYIAGTATDETRLKEIHVYQPGTTAGSVGTKYTIAKYVGGEWVAGDTLPTHWKADSVVVNETRAPGQKGHAVEYKVAIDMTSWGVGKGFDVFATAGDGSDNTSTATVGTAQTTEAVPTNHYKMDFVPYIKSISDKNGEDAPRSRLGRYPIRAGEKIRINGMNFAKNATYTVTFKKSDGTVVSTVANANVTKVKTGVISVTAPNYSCWVEVNVDGEDAPNNGNDNTVGYNVQKGKFRLNAAKTRMEAKDDDEGAAFWVDDCYLSVWKVGTTFDDSPNPIMGTVERMTPNTERWILKQRKGKNQSGTGTPTDGSLTAIWGGEDNMTWEEVLSGNYAGSRGPGLAVTADAGFKSPPSQTDMVIIKGGTSAKVGDMIMYVVLDDGWADQGTFGRGLLLARDGTSVQSDLYTLEKTADDKQRDQFQNPKITGFYSATDKVYYVYVTYYDKYTKCLKYAYAKCKDDNSGNNNYSDHFVERIAASDYDNDKRSPVVIDGTDTVGGGSDIGQWSDVKVLGGKPVVVYYDKIGKQLKYAIGNATKPTSWTKGKLNKPAGSDFGRFVSIEVDGGNNVHIVAQDANNAVLYYGCTASLGSTITWHKLDATSSVGRWTDIKLEAPTASGYAAKPVVTYMDTAYLNTTKAVKVAYFDKVTTVGTGTNAKEIVSFEAMTDPTTWEASDMKLSIVTNPLEGDGTSYSRYGIGINSTELAVDYLRGEE